MTLLGIGGFDHNGSVAVIGRDHVVHFLELERPSRCKNVGVDDISLFGKTLDRLCVRDVTRIAVADREWWQKRRSTFEPYLQSRFGNVVIQNWRHHDCHAASALVSSPWDHALVITMDGKGDGLSATASLMSRSEGVTRRICEIPSRDSLGRMWWAVSEYCGFPGHHSAGKTMAYAAYGNDDGLFDDVIHVGRDGRFRIQTADSHPDLFRRVDTIVEWIEQKTGCRKGTNQQVAQNVAASLQSATERAMVRFVGAAVAESGIRRVALAGGVALNGLVNQRLFDERIVEDLFVVPCCDDRGLSLGAAALSAIDCGQPAAAHSPYLTPYLGPVPDQIPAELDEWQLTGQALVRVAERIAEGAIVAWFSGRDEAGARALGHRSVLATPTQPGMRNRLNAAKGREWFRPFGCAIAVEDVANWFRCDGDSPFMLKIALARGDGLEKIPSALHVDGTSRLQTVCLQRDDSTLRPLLDTLKQIGHPPVIINTSLNTRGEPLAHTIGDAAIASKQLGADLLVIEGAVYEPKRR